MAALIVGAAVDTAHSMPLPGALVVVEVSAAVVTVGGLAWQISNLAVGPKAGAAAKMQDLWVSDPPGVDGPLLRSPLPMYSRPGGNEARACIPRPDARCDAKTVVDASSEWNGYWFHSQIEIAPPAKFAYACATAGPFWQKECETRSDDGVPAFADTGAPVTLEYELSELSLSFVEGGPWSRIIMSLEVFEESTGPSAGPIAALTTTLSLTGPEDLAVYGDLEIVKPENFERRSRNGMTTYSLAAPLTVRREVLVPLDPRQPASLSFSHAVEASVGAGPVR